MKTLASSVMVILVWSMTVVAFGAAARVAFELAVIGFTFAGLWPAK